METKKIAIACFIGAAIGTGVAVIVIPLFWWLGMIAGFGLGYLCYDLKEIREKAPIAWRVAKKGSRYSLNCSLDWLKRPHPVLYPLLMITLVLTFYALESIWLNLDLGRAEKMPLGSKIIVISFFACLIYASIGLLFLSVISGLVNMIAHRKKRYWQFFWFTKEEIEKMREKNYRQIPITYRNVYGLMIAELGYILLTVLLTTPKVLKGIGTGLWQFLCFIFCGMWVLLARFVWYLFKLIRSQKRVLCGFDSAIGVAVTYILLGSKAVTPGQQIMVVICGGIIGAVVGVLDYEIISKRLLHLVPMTNNL